MRYGYRYKEILAAAVEIAREIGWKRVTMRRVAECAGVSRTALRYHFGTAKDMKIAVLVAISKQMRGCVNPFMPIWRDWSKE